ncbi:hypothetical protein DDI_3728 [Dickeya dianthicola RNS04.9]|nr:hypothetical protein DDI_3728 [Dickeya dianthicola RNS04.9]
MNIFKKYIHYPREERKRIKVAAAGNNPQDGLWYKCIGMRRPCNEVTQSGELSP